MVQKGLQSGIQNDSLFFGYHFGMTSDDFHESSWEMNQQGTITGLTKINYAFTELKSQANMEFYPTFKDAKIIRMPVIFEYQAWAPWNQEYWPDQLVEDLVEYYENEYNATFKNVYVPEIEEFARVAIQGNREIRIHQYSESEVLVDFIDLNEFESDEF